MVDIRTKVRTTVHRPLLMWYIYTHMHTSCDCWVLLTSMTSACPKSSYSVKISTSFHQHFNYYLSNCQALCVQHGTLIAINAEKNNNTDFSCVFSSYDAPTKVVTLTKLV